MAKDILKYPGWFYAFGISSGQMSMEEAKIEYQRIYHALRQRQRRLQHSEYKGYKFARTKLTPYSKIKTENQLLENLQHMVALAAGRQTTISGLKEYQKDVNDALDLYGAGGKSFHDMSPSEWTEFGAFMKRVHKANYDSERAVRMFRVAKAAGMTGASLFRDYGLWVQNEQALRDYAEKYDRPLGKRVSSQRIQEFLADKGY